MPESFANFDLADFWLEGEYPDSLAEPEPSDELIQSLEAELDVRLPSAWIELARTGRNGGIPRNRFHATPCATSYGPEDHVEIAEIYAIGRDATWAIGRSGCNTQFWVEDCLYPPIGVYFCNCAQQGHQMLALDYRECGREGEPAVVLVDEIFEYQIIPLAADLPLTSIEACGSDLTITSVVSN